MSAIRPGAPALGTKGAELLETDAEQKARANSSKRNTVMANLRTKDKILATMPQVLEGVCAAEHFCLSGLPEKGARR